VEDDPCGAHCEDVPPQRAPDAAQSAGEPAVVPVDAIVVPDEAIVVSIPVTVAVVAVRSDDEDVAERAAPDATDGHVRPNVSHIFPLGPVVAVQDPIAFVRMRGRQESGIRNDADRTDPPSP
jgi:hypothetical protein